MITQGVFRIDVLIKMYLFFVQEELTSLNLIMDQERMRKNHHEKERRKLERKIAENEKEQDRLVKLAEVKYLASQCY